MYIPGWVKCSCSLPAESLVKYVLHLQKQKPDTKYDQCVVVTCFQWVFLFQLLHGVKGHLSELLVIVFKHLTVDDTVLRNVMATILAAVVAEMSFYSQQVYAATIGV